MPMLRRWDSNESEADNETHLKPGPRRYDETNSSEDEMILYRSLLGSTISLSPMI